MSLSIASLERPTLGSLHYIVEKIVQKIILSIGHLTT